MIIKMLLFPVILLLVLYFVIAKIVPATQNISATKNSIEQEEKKLATANEQLQKIENFKQQIQQHPDEVEYTMDFLPNDQKEEILLSDISQLADKNQISLFSVSFAEGGRQGIRSSASTDGSAQLIETDITVSGTYEDFKKFTHEMFRMKRLYNFKTFNLSKSDNKKEDEEENQQGLMLSGTISFTYEFMPGLGQVSALTTARPINFELIDTILQATSSTNPLVSEPATRTNPFLP